MLDLFGRGVVDAQGNPLLLRACQSSNAAGSFNGLTHGQVLRSVLRKSDLRIYPIHYPGKLILAVFLC